MTNTYETIFICNGEISQDKADSALEKVKSIIAKADGKIGSSEFWGRRRLAYPIKHQKDGFYIYVLFSSNNKAPSALNHHFRVTDAILRGLTVKVDPRNVDKLKPVQRAEIAPAATEPSGIPSAEQAVASPAPQ